MNTTTTTTTIDPLLLQSKLVKEEWQSLEITPLPQEQNILRLIVRGYENTNERMNENLSFICFMRMTNITPEIHVYSYTKYFFKEIENMVKKNTLQTYETNEHWLNIVSFTNQSFSKTKPPKKIDVARFANMEKNIEKHKEHIVEYTQLEFCKKILNSLFKENTQYTLYLYTIIQMKKSTILHLNTQVLEFVNLLIAFVCNIKQSSLIKDIVHDSHLLIEKNKYILKYEDKTLYEHQKQLFNIFKNTDKNIPKLVLYTAPTGTGKTLSPLGLSCEYKIIFICAARHVGLALAKSAICIDKKIAFAFGCETASDIRLHNHAAHDYTINKRSGGIKKINNDVGDRVEIMICDVASYLIAMYYMLSFNEEKNIVLYWDEPTITLDYVEHPLHSFIHTNWKQNKISKVVLSCATLPDEEDIVEIIGDFKNKFDGASLFSISSYDCKKSISILNKNMKSVLPHTLFENHNDLMRSVSHCEKIKSLLRYFDLEEIVRFVEYVNQQEWFNEFYKITHYFAHIEEITLFSLKMYYLEVLKHVNEMQWGKIYDYMTFSQPVKFCCLVQKDNLKKSKSLMDAPSSLLNCGKPLTRCYSTISPLTLTPTPTPTPTPPLDTTGILITTNDAHTLTDGPTIFLAEDVEKVGRFYIQQTKIPSKIFENILEKIAENNRIQEKLDVLNKNMEDKMGKDNEKEKKVEKDNFNPEIKKMMNIIENMRTQIQMISLDPVFVPNTKQHQQVWVPNNVIVENAFTPTIEEPVVREIMELNVTTQMKLLLLMGIGIFVKDQNLKYLEIIKRLAFEQKLYLIIASSDYIYGTNYQFCHCFIGKDLTNMTQQKIIQAMGRVGRSNIQQEYTIRFRDDQFANKLFLPVETNMEAINMCKLFVSDE